MLPMIVCRHYDVTWIDSHTCECRDCRKQGHWMAGQPVIWVRAASSRHKLAIRQHPKLVQHPSEHHRTSRVA